MKHSLKITINEDGTLESEVLDISGPSCEALTAWLDNLGEVKEHKRTPDYFQLKKDKVNRKVTVGK